MKISASLMVAALSLTVWSDAFSANTWLSKMTVYGVQNQTDGGFIIYGPVGADSACAENGKLFYVRSNQNGQSAESVKVTLAIVLTAFASGKTITFMYDNASASCFVQTVLVNP